MFTGLIQYLGTVVALKKDTLVIKSNIEDVKIGDSIAVNGVCLTLTKIDKYLHYDLSVSTREKTNLGLLKPEQKVNIEHSLKIGDSIGGHFVLGHIDGVAILYQKRQDGRFWWMTFNMLPEWMPYLAEQGAIAIDGVSLTIALLDEKNRVSCAIIPATYEKTNFRWKKKGDLFNIELDILARYSIQNEKYKQHTSRITWDFLKNKGYF